MLATIIVIALMAVVIFIGIKNYRNTLAHGCCGAGGGTAPIEAEEKKLDGPVIGTRTVVIEGMTCINCQNRIQRRLNKIDGVSAAVDFKKGVAVISMDREVPDDTIRTAIVQLDYKVKEIR